jgi:hypothetical protein
MFASFICAVQPRLHARRGLADPHHQLKTKIPFPSTLNADVTLAMDEERINVTTHQPQQQHRHHGISHNKHKSTGMEATRGFVVPNHHTNTPAHNNNHNRHQHNVPHPKGISSANRHHLPASLEGEEEEDVLDHFDKKPNSEETLRDWLVETPELDVRNNAVPTTVKKSAKETEGCGPPEGMVPLVPSATNVRLTTATTQSTLTEATKPQVTDVQPLLLTDVTGE